MSCSLVGGDLQTSCGTLDEGGLDDNIDWEEEREMERLACEGDDFVPPKIMVGDQDRNDLQNNSSNVNDGDHQDVG